MKQQAINASAHAPLEERLTFLQEFIKHPLQIGSIIPSSSFLEQRIMNIAELASAGNVVELGAGTGGTTQAILRAMPAQARLLSIEINPRFYSLLRNIRDERLIAHLGSAGELQEIIAAHGLEPPDVIISGIPFSTMTHEAGSAILNTIATALQHNGRFVAYQVSNRVHTLCRPLLGMGDVELELRNIPPMRVFRWKKNGAKVNDTMLRSS